MLTRIFLTLTLTVHAHPSIPVTFPLPHLTPNPQTNSNFIVSFRPSSETHLLHPPPPLNTSPLISMLSKDKCYQDPGPDVIQSNECDRWNIGSLARPGGGMLLKNEEFTKNFNINMPPILRPLDIIIHILWSIFTLCAGFVFLRHINLVIKKRHIVHRYSVLIVIQWK